MKNRNAFTLIELIVVIVIVALLIAMLLPAINAGKGVARKMQCVNHLKQIGIGFHNYHDTRGSLPPAFAVDNEEEPLYGWRVHILPFIEQQTLYDLFHLDEAWDGNHNATLFEKRPSIYTCPQQYRFQGQAGDCPYGMIVGPNTISDGPHAIKLSDITDGTSNTILVAETRRNIPWPSAIDISFESLNWGILKRNDPKALENGICSRHQTEDATTAFADGSVRIIPANIKPEILKALATINDGEKIEMPDLGTQQKWR